MYATNNKTCLMAIFQDNLTWEMRYQNVFVMDFIGANGDN